MKKFILAIVLSLVAIVSYGKEMPSEKVFETSMKTEVLKFNDAVVSVNDVVVRQFVQTETLLLFTPPGLTKKEFVSHNFIFKNTSTPPILFASFDKNTFTLLHYKKTWSRYSNYDNKDCLNRLENTFLDQENSERQNA